MQHLYDTFDRSTFQYSYKIEIAWPEKAPVSCHSQCSDIPVWQAVVKCSYRTKIETPLLFLYIHIYIYIYIRAHPIICSTLFQIHQRELERRNKGK